MAKSRSSSASSSASSSVPSPRRRSPRIQSEKGILSTKASGRKKGRQSARKVHFEENLTSDLAAASTDKSILEESRIRGRRTLIAIDKDTEIGQDEVGLEDVESATFFGEKVLERIRQPDTPLPPTPQIDADLLDSPESAVLEKKKLVFGEEDEVVSGAEDLEDGADLGYSSADSSVHDDDGKKEDASDSDESKSDSESESSEDEKSESESEDEDERKRAKEKKRLAPTDAGKRIIERTEKFKAYKRKPVAYSSSEEEDSGEESDSSDESDESEDYDIDAREFMDEWVEGEDYGSDAERENIRLDDVDETDLSEVAIVNAATKTPQPSGVSMSMSSSKIIDPKNKGGDKTPGVRRSKRTRWKPLAHWKGERLVVQRVKLSEKEAAEARKKRRYSVGIGVLHGDASSVKAIQSVKVAVKAVKDRHFKTPHKRAYQGKKRGRKPGTKFAYKKRKRDGEGESEDEEEAAEPPIIPADFAETDPGVPVPCYDEIEKRVIDKDCVRLGREIQLGALPEDTTPMLVEGMGNKAYGVANAGAAFDDSRFISGIVEINPLCRKPFEGTHACTQVFVVVSAQRRSVEVCIEDKYKYLLSSGDHFWVPNRCTYQIVNRSQSIPAKFHFVLVKPSDNQELLGSPEPALSPQKRAKTSV